jgi:hypothetical protein
MATSRLLRPSRFCLVLATSALGIGGCGSKSPGSPDAGGGGGDNGGSSSTGGSGGSGGTSSSGGTNSSGGTSSTGGSGGTSSTGGSGGTSSTGGSGGTSSTGGSGGTSSTGGSGGTSSTGGSSGGSSSGDSGGSGTDGGDAGGPVSPWNNVAIGAGGFISGIVFSPVQKNLAYARADVGGFYRWNGATSTWTPLTDSFSISQNNYFGGESIVPDPVDANVVYAAAGEYMSGGNGVILSSTDQGTTWTVNTIGVPMGGNQGGRGMGERLAVDPNDNKILLFGSRSNGLYKSINSAATWTEVTSFPVMGDATYGLPVVLFDKTGGTAAGSTNIFVAAASTSAGSNLYQTKDGGTSWSLVTGTGTGPTGLMVHHAALGSDGNLWLAYGSNYGPYNTGTAALSGQVWKYATATGAWTNVTPSLTTQWCGATGCMAGGVSVDATNPMHAVISTLDWYQPDRLLATTDGGTTWMVIAQPLVSYNTTGLSTYDVNGVLWWTVGGADIGTGATNWVEAVALDPFNSDHVMYGTGGGIWSSTNISAATAGGAGATWTFLDQGLEETVPIFLMPSINGAFLGSIGDLAGMRNASLAAYSSTGEYTNPTFTNTNGIDFAESNPMFVVRVGNSGAVASDVAYSTDNGVTWTPCAVAPTGYTTDDEMSSVAVAADASGFVVSPYAGYGSPAYTTHSAASTCATWKTSTGLPSGAVVAADRVTAKTFYATSGHSLYVSTNSGATFTVAATLNGTAGYPRPVFGEAGEVWVAISDGSLYRFTNVGTSAPVVSTIVSTVTSAYGVGFGKAATGQTHPATYVLGTVGGQYGFFRSDDGIGTSWVRINDDAHQYGWVSFIGGDENTYGRAFVATGGRGYVYRDGP